MEENIKTLPVSTNSASKGYITYNPTKIDIIPVISSPPENNNLNEEKTDPLRGEMYPLAYFSSDESAFESNLKESCICTNNDSETKSTTSTNSIKSITPSAENAPKTESMVSIFKDIHCIFDMDVPLGSVKEEPSSEVDQFEVVTVKCDTDEHFYPETSLIKSRSQSRLASETPEQRAKRLIAIRDAARVRRQQETQEQRAERLRKDREKKRNYRARMRQEHTYEQVLARNRIVMRMRRQDEAYRERERERDRIRHQIRRADVEFRHQEKIKERERKRLSRFLNRCAQQCNTFQQFPVLQQFAQQLFPPHVEQMFEQT